MKNKKYQTSAVDILRERYIGDDLEREVSIREERVNAEVARTIYKIRKESRLTQKELAKMVNTTQSVISRLEDADYEGHSLKMLNRIAMALNHQLRVIISPKKPSIEQNRYASPKIVAGMRNKKGALIMAGGKKPGGKARSAITGRYVKKDYAKKHPKTTVVERDKPKRKK